MRYKELTEEDKEYLTQIYFEREMSHKEKMDILTRKFEAAARTIRRWWKEELKLTDSIVITDLPKQLVDAMNRQIPEDTDIILITAAQNKTGINLDMLRNMIAYKEYLDDLGFNTVIVIAPARYRNPTAPAEYLLKKNTQSWWRDEVNPYLYFGKIQFGDGKISTDSRIVPTAKKPLRGFEVLAKDNHLILPHPRIHFQTMPRFKNAPLRTMSTTGFITHKNYSDSKAGETAFEHHSYGFSIVEKKPDGTCHTPRNVKVKADGSFIDLVYEVSKGEVKVAPPAKGIVWGDLHAAEVNREVFDATLDLYSVFKPAETVIHDALDASTVNPHETKDMFIQRLKIAEKRYLIKDEIEHCFDLLGQIMDTGTKMHVVISNHDIFLDRYINDGNWKNDLHNSPAYLEMALIQQTEDLRKYGSIFGYLLYMEYGDNIHYVNFGESVDIGGYECAMHGDHGVNGARGSQNTFSKMNTKMITGHTHQPAIMDGHTQVGVTCNLNQYYTRRGISSWAHGHSIIHANDKNQLIVFGNDYKFTELI